MSDLRQALAEINAIRTQVARGALFRGYGPLAISASGAPALSVAALQSRFSRFGELGVAGVPMFCTDGSSDDA